VSKRTLTSNNLRHVPTTNITELGLVQKIVNLGFRLGLFVSLIFKVEPILSKTPSDKKLLLALKVI